MENKTVSELITIARGDRTKKQYAEDSGVNIAIISRIENANYTPGKKVLEKLTSAAAKPQGGVTYQDLIEATNKDKQFKKGLVTGMAALPIMGIPVIGPAAVAGVGIKAVTSASKANKKSKKDEKKFFNEMKDFATGMERYRATATGIIIAKLAENGTWCRPGKQEDTDFPLNYTDQVLLIENNEINNWILSCFTINEENKSRKDFIKNFSARFVDKLVHTKPDPRKKASFVVDDESLYNHLLELKDNISYRGNLSIIQFDAKNVKIVKEEFLSYYDLNHMEDKLMLLRETN